MLRYAQRLGASFSRHWDENWVANQEFVEIAALVPLDPKYESRRPEFPNMIGFRQEFLERGQNEWDDVVVGDASKGFHAVVWEGFTERDGEEIEIIDDRAQGLLLCRNFPCQ